MTWSRIRSALARPAAGLLLSACWLAGCGGLPAAGDPHATRQPAPDTDHGLPAGPRLRDPPEPVGHDGVLKAAVVVERRKVRVGDRLLYATVYNGAYMPPTLRVRPVDRIDVTPTNRVAEDTNVHTHGLHVSPRAPSDDWYHSHADMTSAPQVAGGESGVIVVEGLQQHLPPSLRGITERTIALKDFQVEGDSVRTHPLSIGAPTNRTVTGRRNPVIGVRPGESQVWRLADIGANISYKLHLPGSRFRVIAQDGIPVRGAYDQDTLLIAAGARFDVLAQGGPPGTARLETLAHDTGPAGNKLPRADLATVVTGGPPSPAGPCRTATSSTTRTWA